MPYAEEFSMKIPGPIILLGGCTIYCNRSRSLWMGMVIGRGMGGTCLFVSSVLIYLCEPLQFADNERIGRHGSWRSRGQVSRLY